MNYSNNKKISGLVFEYRLINIIIFIGILLPIVQFIIEHDYHQDFSGILDSINESCKNYNLKIKHLTDHELPSYLIVNRK